MYKQTDIRDYYADSEFMQALPTQTLTRLKRMEQAATLGVPSWQYGPVFHEEVTLFGMDALTVMGYYELRASYGKINRCNKCDVCIKYTAKVKDICAICTTRVDKVWITNCFFCTQGLGSTHNYKTFGGCCKKCSKDLTTSIKKQKKTEDLDEIYMIRLQCKEAITQRKHKNEARK